jgi:PAS domain S-box-containing protein
LYGFGFVTSGSILHTSFLVPDHVAIFAGISAFVSVVAYFWVPKKHLYAVALAVYLALAVTIGALLHHSGLITSPFIALGMIGLVFSGLFGLSGLGLLAVAVNGFLVFDLLILKETITTSQQLVVFVLGYEVPLAASWLIWHTKSSRESDHDKAYNALAQELSQVANKSEIVINAIADGVIAIDGKGIIQLINPAAQKILGWGKHDALELDYRTLFKLEDENGKPLNQAQHPVEETLKVGKQVLRNDVTLETKSNKKIFISLLTSPAGQPGAGAIIVFRDITQEKTEERQQAEFISTASHEMRTPVASIEGYLGLALNPNTAAIDDKARLYLTKAHESAQHLGRLFQDLLDISRVEDGRLVNNPKVVDIVAFTQDIVNNFEVRAKEKGLILLFKPVSEGNVARQLSPVFYANVDNDHLREILSNLIDNAIKYTNKGDVTVNITGDTEHVRISISDTGIGIPPEDIPHLFQKFYRVDNSDTREIGGTGLGLYLCRRLIEQMDGRIWIESEYHKGSTFFIELPRLSHEEATHRIELAAANTEHQKEAATSSVPATPLLDQQPPTSEAPPPVKAPASVPASVAQPTPVISPAPTIQTSPIPNTPSPTIQAAPVGHSRDAIAIPTRKK